MQNSSFRPRSLKKELPLMIWLISSAISKKIFINWSLWSYGILQENEELRKVDQRSIRKRRHKNSNSKVGKIFWMKSWLRVNGQKLEGNPQKTGMCSLLLIRVWQQQVYPEPCVQKGERHAFPLEQFFFAILEVAIREEVKNAHEKVICIYLDNKAAL